MLHALICENWTSVTFLETEILLHCEKWTCQSSSFIRGHQNRGMISLRSGFMHIDEIRTEILTIEEINTRVLLL